MSLLLRNSQSVSRASAVTGLACAVPAGARWPQPGECWLRCLAGTPQHQPPVAEAGAGAAKLEDPEFCSALDAGDQHLKLDPRIGLSRFEEKLGLAAYEWFSES